MSIDPETLMAYADGECDPLTARRVEKAMAADPAIAAEVEAHRALRMQLSNAFAPVADEPIPARIAASLASNVVAFPGRPRRRFSAAWAGAVAASLVVGLVLGRGLMPAGPVATGGSGLVAGGALARALDTQLGSDGARDGVRMLASFRAQDGALCRVFTATRTSGIACRDGQAWALRRTMTGVTENGAYRQAASPTAALMTDAQDLMAGEPLDTAAERAAVARGWR